MMKKILILSSALLMLLVTGCNSQQKSSREQRNPEQEAERMVEHLKQELNLTEAQQSELKTYFTASFKKRSENFEKNKDNRKERREQMKHAQEETDARLKEILTEEQYNKHKELQENRQKERERQRELMLRESAPRDNKRPR